MNEKFSKTVLEDEYDFEMEEKEINKLKPLVTEYHHSRDLPDLPEEPDGALHGIGFIYDEDRDDRVLVAINNLKDNKDIVALAECKGCVDIYTRKSTGLTWVSAYDEWSVTEHVPYWGGWRQVGVN